MLAGICVIVNALIGCVASMRNSQNLFIVHLVVSVLVMFASIGCGLMAWYLNLEPIGTDRHPSWGSNLCVVYRYDHSRLVKMNYHHTVWLTFIG